MTPLEKADRAKEMLESAIFKAVFEDIRERLVSRLEAAPFGDEELHHKIKLLLQSLVAVKVEFQRYISDSAVVKHNDKQDEYMRKMRASIRQGDWGG